MIVAKDSNHVANVMRASLDAQIPPQYRTKKINPEWCWRKASQVEGDEGGGWGRVRTERQSGNDALRQSIYIRMTKIHHQRRSVDAHSSFLGENHAQSRQKTTLTARSKHRTESQPGQPACQRQPPHSLVLLQQPHVPYHEPDQPNDVQGIAHVARQVVNRLVAFPLPLPFQLPSQL